MKSNRSAQKRFKKIGSGKIKRNQMGTLHNLGKKSPKRKRNLRKSALLHKSDVKRIKKLIGYSYIFINMD